MHRYSDAVTGMWKPVPGHLRRFKRRPETCLLYHIATVCLPSATRGPTCRALSSLRPRNSAATCPSRERTSAELKNRRFIEIANFAKSASFAEAGNMKTIAIGATVLVLSVATAFAQTHKVGDIEVTNAWAPATTGAKLTNSAAYMSLVDQGSKSDELIAASSAVAQKVELHVFEVENGVYGMHGSTPSRSPPARRRRSFVPAART